MYVHALSGWTSGFGATPASSSISDDGSISSTIPSSASRSNVACRIWSYPSPHSQARTSDSYASVVGSPVSRS
ncbi:MAG: hypothetical protein ABEJ43_01860 [Haloferacaceae archaeon]